MNKDMKNYYVITTSMTFQKTVLVPVDAVEDIDEAIEAVDAAVETCEIELLSMMDADCKTKPSEYADINGMYELTDEEAELYQVIDPRE